MPPASGNSKDVRASKWMVEELKQRRMHSPHEQGTNGCVSGSWVRPSLLIAVESPYPYVGAKQHHSSKNTADVLLVAKKRLLPRAGDSDPHRTFERGPLIETSTELANASRRREEKRKKICRHTSAVS